MRRVGFQGLRGAYSEMAIHQHFAGVEVVAKAYPSFEAVFMALNEARIHDALLPFENSLAGMIHENYDHLARFPVTLVGEAILQVQHCLLLPKGHKLKDVKTVLSHPQALAQCSQYLAKQGWTPRNYFDTAGAAAFLAEQPQSGFAAIASETAAKLYGLEIAAKQIADRGHNYTRFLHLKALRKKTSKPSIPEGPGRLFSLLLLRAGAGFGRIGPLCGILQSLGIELVHCEARPTKDKAWSYYYFLELAAGPEHPSWKLALDTLTALTPSWKYLGSYRSSR